MAKSKTARKYENVVLQLNIPAQTFGYRIRMCARVRVCQPGNWCRKRQLDWFVAEFTVH